MHTLCHGRGRMQTTAACQQGLTLENQDCERTSRVPFHVGEKEPGSLTSAMTPRAPGGGADSGCPVFPQAVACASSHEVPRCPHHHPRLALGFQPSSHMPRPTLSAFCRGQPGSQAPHHHSALADGLGSVLWSAIITPGHWTLVLRPAMVAPQQVQPQASYS